MGCGGRTRRLSENGYFPQSLRQAHPAVAGLKILQCILAVNSADSGTPSLTLQKISHSRTASWESDSGDGNLEQFFYYERG